MTRGYGPTFQTSNPQGCRICCLPLLAEIFSILAGWLFLDYGWILDSRWALFPPEQTSFPTNVSPWNFQAPRTVHIVSLQLYPRGFHVRIALFQSLFLALGVHRCLPARRKHSSCLPFPETGSLAWVPAFGKFSVLFLCSYWNCNPW